MLPDIGIARLGGRGTLMMVFVVILDISAITGPCSAGGLVSRFTILGSLP